MEVRIDVSDLENEEPALASRFLSLRDTLDTTFEEPSGGLMSAESPLQTWRGEPRGQREMDAELRQVIDWIRTLPGFERFLLPPSAEECMAAADLVGGPIVAINVSRYRCDALLIERNQIRSLRLDRLHESEIDDKVRAMKRFGIDSPILEWLWDVAAGPILSELGFHTPPANEDWPHIWWILTGPLSHLPIHAAGYHGNWSSDNVLDRVMSSYTSSIKALVHSRRNKTQQQPTTPLGTGGSGQGKSTDQGAYPHHALLVAMPDTPGILTSLPYACKEVEMIEGICLSMNLQPIRPPARRSEVLQEMRACQIFHFAGHGQSQPQEPSESHILLDDWMTDPLTVADFRSFRFGKNPPFLAFLSACLTSVNDADDLVDEGIHLSGAFHLAGFRNVVGTLWEVSDLHCVDVARIVYETLRDIGMTDYAICLGLHHAVRALRDRTIGKSHGKNKVNSSFQGGIVPTVTTSGETEAPKTQIDHVGSAEEVHEGRKGDRAWRPAKLLTPMTWQTSTQEHPRYWAPYIHFG
jgi:CHAT domain-containing protein